MHVKTRWIGTEEEEQSSGRGLAPLSPHDDTTSGGAFGSRSQVLRQTHRVVRGAGRGGGEHHLDFRRYY